MKKAIALMTCVLYVIFGFYCDAGNVLSFTMNVQAQSKSDNLEILLADYLTTNINAQELMTYKSPYRFYVEKRRENTAYINAIAAWKIATFGSFSDLDKLTYKQIGFYETILFDVLGNGEEQDIPLDELNKYVKSYQAGLYKKIYTSTGKCGEQLLSSYKKGDKEYSEIVDTIAASSELSDIFNSIDKPAQMLDYCTNIVDMVYKCASLRVYYDRIDSILQILKDIQGQTGDKALYKACENMIMLIENKADMLDMVGFFTAKKTIEKLWEDFCGELWDKVLDHLTSYGYAIKAGQYVGKLYSNMLFNTDKEIETLYSCMALYEYENCLDKALDAYCTKFKKDKTADNAKLVVDAYRQKMIIQIQGATYAKNYIQETYTNGFIKDLYTGIFRWEDYQNTINDLDSIKEKYREFYRYICYGVYSDLVGIYETSDEFHDIVEAIKIEELNITEANFYDIVMQIENCSQKYYGFNITSSTTLNKDVITYCDINMSSNLYLNGHTLVTYGNLIQTAGQMSIGSGTLSVGGDYRIQTPQTDEEGNVTYDKSDGYLKMEDVDGRVIVEGSFVTSSVWPRASQASGTPYNQMNAGKIRIGRDFYQYTTTYGDNFAPTGTHKVVFTGNKKHVVHFDSTNSKFNIVEVENGGRLVQDNVLAGIKLTQDMTVEGNLTVNSGTLDLNGYTLTVTDDFVNDSTITLNGGTLNVGGQARVNGYFSCNNGKAYIKGDLIQTAGQMSIGSGTLSVGGDYRIQTPQTDEAGNVTYGKSDGYLYMADADGRVIVEGTFATSSVWSRSSQASGTPYNQMNAGEIRIGRDFYQYTTTYDDNFAPSGTHKVVFTGNKKHVVHFDSTSSRFNIVEVHKSQDLLDMTNAKYNSLTVDDCDYQKGKCSICGDIENGVGMIRGTSITLSDSISINFYAELSDDAIDSGNVKMQFTHNNTTVLVAPDDVVRKVNGVNYYRFECVLNSKQMDDAVNAKLLLNDREGTELDYSVKEYIDQMSERTDEAAIKAQALLKTTYAYGQIAKGYFNKEQTVIDDAINEKIDSIDLSSLKSQNIYNKTDDGIDGISYYGDSLLLDSQIRERFYFKLDSGEDINSFIFTCNNEVVAPKYKSGLYYIDIAGSSPHKLDKANVVIVTKGSHKLQIENSPISYIYCMKDNGDKDLMKLLKAIVLYYQEAKNYIN